MKNILLLISSLFICYNSFGMQSNIHNTDTVIIENTVISRFETPALIVYSRKTPVRTDFVTYCKATTVTTATAYDSSLKPIEGSKNPHALFLEIQRQYNNKQL